MAIKIAMYNQKGGAGKTSGTFQLVGLLANEHNKKVLAVDIDPQGNLTKMFSSYTTKESFPLLVDVLENRADLNEAILQVLFQSRANAKPKYYNVDLIGTGKHFTESLVNKEVTCLDEIIKGIEDRYDYIIFDCPTQSEISLLMVQTLIATNYIVCPCSLDTDSTDGYGALLDTVTNIKVEGYNNNLSVIGMFYSGVGRCAYENWLIETTQEAFGEQYLGSIRISKDVKESRHYSRPLTWYKKNSDVTNDYRFLLDNIMKIVEK